METKNCLVEGCTKPVQAKGFCAVHYQRQRKGIDLTKPVRKRKLKGSDNQLDIFPVDNNVLS